MKNLLNEFLPKVLGLVIFFLFAGTAHAVPPPPALAELCKNSDIIVMGEYVGGMVSEVN